MSLNPPLRLSFLFLLILALGLQGCTHSPLFPLAKSDIRTDNIASIDRLIAWASPGHYRVPDETGVHYDSETEFLVFGTPSLNTQGDVAFWATKSRGEKKTNGVWFLSGASDQDNPKRIVQENDVLGGAGSASSQRISSRIGQALPLNSQGQLSFRANRATSNLRNAAALIAVKDPETDSPRIVAGEGWRYRRPGGSIRSAGVNPHVLGDDGTLVFRTSLVDPLFASGYSTGIAAHDTMGNTSDMVAVATTTTPSTEIPFEGFWVSDTPTVAVTPGGDVHVAFKALANGSYGIWRASQTLGQGDFRLQHISSGIEQSATWPFKAGFHRPVVNRKGQLAFIGVIPTSVTGPDYSVWTYNPDLGYQDRLSELVSTGDLAPGRSNGSDDMSSLLPQGSFARLSDVVIDRIGDVAFKASLEGDGITDSDNEGIWAYAREKSALLLVARKGEQAAGAEGAKYQEFGAPSMNGKGRVAFWARLDNGSEGIWVADMAGNITNVIRSGLSIFAPDGLATRVVKKIYFAGHERYPWAFAGSLGTGNEDGRPSSFNDVDQLVFTVIFERFENADFPTVPWVRPDEAVVLVSVPCIGSASDDGCR